MDTSQYCTKLGKSMMGCSDIMRKTLKFDPSFEVIVADRQKWKGLDLEEDTRE